jgi:nucleotide-binding universal stress UspA family protein
MRVILATDGSKHAEQAASLLARLPHAQPLELIVLAVTPMLDFHGSLEVVEWMKRSKEAEKVKALEVCQRIERLFEGANARVQSRVIEGHPGSTIVGLAESWNAELVVLGAMGMNMLDRLMLGSVSDFVATHAPCSVLVVRPNQTEGTRHDLKLCIADDESPPSRFALKDLSTFGWGGHTHVDVVNVVLSPLTYSDIPFDFDAESIRLTMLEQLNARLGEYHALSPHVQTHVVESSHIGEGLVDFARRHASDILVLGSTGRSILARFLLGSASRFALRHAHCSVWIARQRASQA